MTEDRRRHLEGLFEQVLDRPSEAWDSAVTELCGEDGALREDLRKLLRAHRMAEGLLERPLDREQALALEGLGQGEKEGARIGRFRILQELGRGGMGRVYLGERADGQFRQRVAVKLISDVDPELHHRVVAERQILASLEHPNIGRLLDGGVTEDGRPYLVLEYVNGLPIDLYCDRMRLTLRERLRLFLTVLEAVEHAHHNLVVHRDLKPSNILVTPSGDVKLLDFGIAKLLNPNPGAAAADSTRTQDRALTPEYASPEQIRGEAITTAADVYSLGVVLYRLLSGQPPYRLPVGDLPELVRVICEVDPPPPSQGVTCPVRQPSPDPAWDPSSGESAPEQDSDLTEVARRRRTTSGRLQRQLKGDLDAMVLKALRKEPQRRYGSAALMAQDIQNFLEELPVQARKGTRWYRFRKLARRHRGAALAATLVVASLVGGAGTAAWQAGVASRERDRATEALRESEEISSYLLGLFQASDPWEDPRGEITALDLLGRGVLRANQLREEPRVQARMLEVMAEAYQNLGRYAEAQNLSGRVVDLLISQAGEKDPEVRRSMVEWGLALSRDGRYDSARVVLARARRLQEEADPSAPELSSILEAQARVDIYLGQLETAEERAREALALRERIYGPEATPTINTLGVVASILRFQGRYPEAEAVFRDVLARRRRLEFPSPVALSSDLLQIAGMAVEYGGDLNEAEGMITEALSLQDPGSGNGVVNRVWALTSMAELEEARGNPVEAEHLFRDALSERRRVFGNMHPLVAESLGRLGMHLKKVGRHAEAEATLREAVEVNLRTAGPLHTRYAGSLTGLAEVLTEEGRLTEADSLASEALHIRKQAQGPGVITVAETLSLLARVRRMRGMQDSAESLLLQALEIVEGIQGRPPLHRTLHGQLADLYEALGRREESAHHRGLSYPST